MAGCRPTPRMQVFLFLAATAAWAGPDLSREEAELVRIINEARSQPARFAERHIRPEMRRMREAAECYREMKALRPMGSLTVSEILTAAARDHALDMGRRGRLGHTGSDGSNLGRRIERHGFWFGRLAENSFYGQADPLRMVVELLIDRGVPDRGHRRNLLDQQFRYVGVAIRPHRTYRLNAVMDFAEQRPAAHGATRRLKTPATSADYFE